jgi:DNA repair protein RadA
MITMGKEEENIIDEELVLEEGKSTISKKKKTTTRSTRKKKSTKKSNVGLDLPEKVERPKIIKRVEDLDFSTISGISETSSEKIKQGFLDKDIYSVTNLANKKIADILIGRILGEKMASKVLQYAREAAGIPFMKRVSEIHYFDERLKLGIEEIDEVIGGGFLIGDSYEFFGGYGSGKTQFIVTIVARSQLPKEKGGLYDPSVPFETYEQEDGSVTDNRPYTVWMETEDVGRCLLVADQGGYSRLREVADGQYRKEYPDASEEEVMEYVKNVEDHVYYLPIRNAEQQINVFNEIEGWVSNNNVKIIVVDSIIGRFRQEYSGIGKLAERQQALNKHLHELFLLKGNYAMLLCTNQVSTKIAIGYGVTHDDAVGGHVISHNLNNRFQLRRGAKNTYVGKIKDSSHLAPSEWKYIITKNGIEGVSG